MNKRNVRTAEEGLCHNCVIVGLVEGEETSVSN